MSNTAQSHLDNRLTVPPELAKEIERVARLHRNVPTRGIVITGGIISAGDEKTPPKRGLLFRIYRLLSSCLWPRRLQCL